MIKFFSQARHWSWPGPNNHWTLNTDQSEHDFKLACQDGEQICYGGSNTADDRIHWGIGFMGNKGCNGCCLNCGSNIWHAWNLNGGAPLPKTSGGFGDDNIAVPAQE